MIAAEIMARAAADLNDLEHTRWPEPDLLGFVNDARRAVALLRPDALSETRAVELAAGNTRQVIPDDALRLLDVIRNLGADGVTPGQAVTLIKREALDAANLFWHGASGASTIDHFSFDERLPRVFYVSPPPAAGVHLDLALALAPADLSAASEDLGLPDTFAEPVREYLMYRAWGRNLSDATDRARAESHLSRFYLALGEEAKAAVLLSPNRQGAGA